MGRPSKLTPGIQEDIVERIRAGVHGEVAARAAGISERTFYLWKEKGESGEGRYSQFLQSIKEAEAEAEEDALRAIREAATGWKKTKTRIKQSDKGFEETVEESEERNWQAAAWYLERKHPERWARPKEAAEPTYEEALDIVLQALETKEPEAQKLLLDALRRAALTETPQATDGSEQPSA